MIADIAADAAGYDYLSVSFGYTAELWRFWQRCGFTLVRLGTHREASSGCYTAMALYPLTAAGRQLAQREAQRLQRDEYWLRPWREESAPLPAVADAMLSDEDWLEAASFAFAHRPLAAALGCLNRLLMQRHAVAGPAGTTAGQRGGRTLRRAAADGAKSLAGEMASGGR